MHRRIALAVLVTVTGLAALGLQAAGTPAFAQTHSEIAVTRADIQAERQAIVAENLPLTEDQARAFWPLYRQYRADLETQGDRMVALVESYAKSYDTMTDEQARKMLDEFLSIQAGENKVRTSWVPKLAKVLPAKSLVRFYQIENKLDLIVRISAASEIPLLEPKP